MVIIHILLLGIILGIMIRARKEPKSTEIRFFARSSNWIKKKTDAGKIYIPRDVIAWSLCVLMVGNLLGFIFTLKEAMDSRDIITTLEREDMDTSYDVTLEAGREDGTTQEVILTIPEREYEKSEIQKWFREGRENIEELILGDNISLSHVEQKLDLIERLPDTPVQVSWVSSDPKVLDWEGNPGTDLEESGTEITLYFTFTCQDMQQESSLHIRVYSSSEPEESWLQKVQSSFEKQNNSAQDVYYLPDMVDGERVRWSRGADRTGGYILLISFAGVILLIIGKNREQEQQKEKREEQMMTDYPEILNKFVLLLNAGMNSRRAMGKIALDYKEQKTEQNSVRAAYEEILLTCQEMEQGISEADAYERFGNRCNLSIYKSFSTLLVQNLRKGNQELMNILEREAVDAFENRKRRARIKGEKAGTKLLIPMVLMLVLVFVILLYPASQSFI